MPGKSKAHRQFCELEISRGALTCFRVDSRKTRHSIRLVRGSRKPEQQSTTFTSRRGSPLRRVTSLAQVRRALGDYSRQWEPPDRTTAAARFSAFPGVHSLPIMPCFRQ
jgi:hypothetical protein